jgi:hypothetical protein
MRLFSNNDATKAVDYLFQVFTTTYGEQWERALGAVPVNDAKTVWAYQLSQFKDYQAAKKSILWSLKNLPTYVPTSLDFCNLCRVAYKDLASETETDALQEPEKIKLMVTEVKKKMDYVGKRDWIKKLQVRKDAGEKLHAFQLACLKAAQE